jgi:hypothetical protein
LAYGLVPNHIELSQGVLIFERVTDSVQTDHLDWGFKFTNVYGTDYRFTTAKGYFSDQLLKHGIARVGLAHRRIPRLCQTHSGIVPRMRLPRTRFCCSASLITICEAIQPPGIGKVAQNWPSPNRLS